MSTRHKVARTKAIVYGAEQHMKFLVRQQGAMVRFQDHLSGEVWVIPPALARRFSSALSYAARHAEEFAQRTEGTA